MSDQDKQREEARQRALRIDDEPLDTIIGALCESYGYGAVMDSAARLWALKDPMGAFYIGGCLGMRSLNKRRADMRQRIIRLVSIWPIFDRETGEILGPLWLVERNGMRQRVRRVWRKARRTREPKL